MSAYRGHFIDPNRAALQRHMAKVAGVQQDRAAEEKRQARASLSPQDRRRLEKEDHEQALRAHEETERRNLEARAGFQAAQQRPDGFAWADKHASTEED